MLDLYIHPLASYCWKALLALYEADIPFTPRVIDLADPPVRPGSAVGRGRANDAAFEVITDAPTAPGYAFPGGGHS